MEIDRVYSGYQIGEIIGIGAYGEVRYARHVESGTEYAIKIVDIGRYRDETASRLLREVKIMKSINHENCISIVEVHDNVPFEGKWCTVCACSHYDATLLDGTCVNCGPHYSHDHSEIESRNVMFIVQELASGGELFGLLMHCGAFPEDLARFYFRQLIAGVEYCHSKGIIHRDLKPENLVLDSQFRLKIVDFGLASIVEETSDSRTIKSGALGSLPYSAPEVYYNKELFNGSGYRGEPADIWSCAVILYIMLAGKPPFVRPLHKNVANARRCKHFVNLLGGYFPPMSTGAKGLLRRLFELDPNDRPTIEEIKQDPWFNGPVPKEEEIGKMMEERANTVWLTQQKKEMIEVLSKNRKEIAARKAADQSAHNSRKMQESMDITEAMEVEKPSPIELSSPPLSPFSPPHTFDCASPSQMFSPNGPFSSVSSSSSSSLSGSPTETLDSFLLNNEKDMPKQVECVTDKSLFSKAQLVSPSSSASSSNGFDPFAKANINASIYKLTDKDEQVFRSVDAINSPTSTPTFRAVETSKSFLGRSRSESLSPNPFSIVRKKLDFDSLEKTEEKQPSGQTVSTRPEKTAISANRLNLISSTKALDCILAILKRDLVEQQIGFTMDCSHPNRANVRVSTTGFGCIIKIQETASKQSNVDIAKIRGSMFEFSNFFHRCRGMLQD